VRSACPRGIPRRGQAHAAVEIGKIEQHVLVIHEAPPQFGVHEINRSLRGVCGRGAEDGQWRGEAESRSALEEGASGV